MAVIKLCVISKGDDGIPLTEGNLEDDEQLDEIEVNQSKHDFQSPKIKTTNTCHYHLARVHFQDFLWKMLS